MFIMGNRRREFPSEHIDKAVRVVINTGKPVAVATRQLGVVEQTLGH